MYHKKRQEAEQSAKVQELECSVTSGNSETEGGRILMEGMEVLTIGKFGVCILDESRVVHVIHVTVGDGRSSRAGFLSRLKTFSPEQL